MVDTFTHMGTGTCISNSATVRWLTAILNLDKGSKEMCESIEEQFESLMDWLEEEAYYKALAGIYRLLDEWAEQREKDKE